MSRLSNQHSWHQTSEQKPNMTPPTSLDVTQEAEMASAGDRWMLEILVPTCVSVLMFFRVYLQNHLHHTFTVSKIRVHVGS